MSLVFVKPRDGVHVRAPDGALIPPEGRALPHDLYLQRRLADGDLVEASELPADDAASNEAASASEAAATADAQPGGRRAAKEKV